MTAGGGARPVVTMPSMPLDELLDGLPVPPLSSTSIPIADVVTDSRDVTPGALFVAIKGSVTDGHDHAEDAARRGAVAVIAARPIAALSSSSKPIPVLVLPDPAAALPTLAVRFFRDPSSTLTVLGVTGTNGKSTTTYLLQSVLAAAGSRCAVLGTLGYAIGHHVYEAPNTTPDALLLQRLFASCRAEGLSHVAMEISSHALALDRIAGTRVTTAAFTNFTQDHLDFHGTMDAYFAAKARVFALTGGRGAVNAEDERVRGLTRRYPGLVTFGTGGRVQATNIRLGLKETHFTLTHDDRARTVTTSLVGEPNIQNALATAALALDLGIEDEVIVRGLTAARAPRGRFELVPTAGNYAVAVDYAHTPDALERLLGAARALKPRRVLLVFGCGGDRDRTKRPRMGALAASLADESWLTSDNPRTEDPGSILDEIEAGMAGGRWRREPDRRAAIRDAVAALREGDLLLVAGKGHEDYQIIGREKRPFDDRAELMTALKEQGR